MDKFGVSSLWAPGSNMDMNEPELFPYEFLLEQPSHKTC